MYFGKRAFDIACAVFGLALFMPFYLFATFLILCEDRRSVFFGQERLGRDRQSFIVYKFRTMCDGSVTRVGRWLRSTGLDETTQFVNVLLGEMGMVGPRPLTAADIARLGWNGPAYDFRFRAPPGITGLAQLLGGKSARHSLQLDRLYIRRRSLWLDLEIVLLSFAVNIAGKARVRGWMRRSRAVRRRVRLAVTRGGNVSRSGAAV